MGQRFSNSGGPKCVWNADGTPEVPGAEGPSVYYPAPLPPLEGNPLFVVEGGKLYPLTPDGFLVPPLPEADVPTIVDPEGGEG